MARQNFVHHGGWRAGLPASHSLEGLESETVDLDPPLAELRSQPHRIQSGLAAPLAAQSARDIVGAYHWRFKELCPEDDQGLLSIRRQVVGGRRAQQAAERAQLSSLGGGTTAHSGVPAAAGA